MSKSIATKFLEAVEKYLLSLGARLVDPGECGFLGYKYALETTVAGTLIVDPYAPKGGGLGIFCRFLNTEQANAFFGNPEGDLILFLPNPHSGKWNLHLPKGRTLEELLWEVQRHIPQSWVSENLA